MGLTLDPATYVCPEDGNDLTGVVRDELEGGEIPTSTYERGFGLPGLGFPFPSGPKPRPPVQDVEFEVKVECPGPEGGGKSHEQSFVGHYSRS